MKDININVLEPNVDLGILIGLLLTDGWVNPKGVIGIANKSDVLLSLFKNKVRTLFQKNNFCEFTDKRTNVKIIELNSVEVVRLMLNVCPTFRTIPFSDGTLPKTRLPKFILGLEQSEIKEILKIMFSADGAICLGVKWNKIENRWKFTRRVTLTCWNPTLKEDIGKLLNSIGIEFKISNTDIIIERNVEILKFIKFIGFLNGVKISRKSKNWEGFEKNQILELAIKTFELKKKDLQKFQTKEDVINFLKSLVPA